MKKQPSPIVSGGVSGDGPVYRARSTYQHLGIMLPKTDPELKQVADAEIKRLIHSREAMTIHDRWFTQPISPNGKALGLPMSYLLKDFWKYPSDYVPN